MLEKCNATHVVMGVTWGARTVVSATRLLIPEIDREIYKTSLEESMKSFEELGDLASEKDAKSLHGRSEHLDTLRIQIFSDVLDDDDNIPRDLENALLFAKTLSKRIKEDQNSKSKPLVYTRKSTSPQAILPDNSGMVRYTSNIEKYS